MTKNSRIITMAEVVVMIILSVMLFQLKIYEGSQISDIELMSANVILIVSYAIAIITWIQQTGNFCSFYFLFLLYLFVCNAGQTLLQFFPDADFLYTYIYRSYRTAYVYKMVVFQAMCILGLNLGVIIALRFSKNNYRRAKESFIIQDANPSKLQDYLFYLTSGLMVITALAQFILRLSVSYSEFYEMREGSSIYIQVLFYFSSFAFYIRNRNDIKKKKLFYLIFAVQIVLYILIGSRTILLPLFSTLAVCFIIVNPDYFSKSRKTVGLFIVGFLILVVLSNVSLSRTSAIGSSGSYSGGVLEVLGQGLHEMGQSAQTTIMTIEKIDAGTKKELTFLYYFLVAFIPRPILSIVGISEPAVGSLSAWVTHMANSNSGFGYSIIGEAYFDFGELGFLFFILLGYVAVKLEQKCIEEAKIGRLFRSQLIAVVLSYSIFLARAQFDLMTSRLRITFFLYLGWLLMYRFKIPTYKREKSGLYD